MIRTMTSERVRESFFRLGLQTAYCKCFFSDFFLSLLNSTKHQINAAYKVKKHIFKTKQRKSIHRFKSLKEIVHPKFLFLSLINNKLRYV